MFLLGYPRSGTSWLGSIFNAHPTVTYRHECLGKKSESLGTLYAKIKRGEPLDTKEIELVVQILGYAHPDVDRPPFFRKEYLTLDWPIVRWLMWATSQKISLLETAYQRMFTVGRSKPDTLVVKETGSSYVMVPAMRALSPDAIVLLFRHPYRIISSIQRGVAARVFSAATESQRKTFWSTHRQHSYLMQLSLSERDILALTDSGFRSLLWRVHLEDTLMLMRERPNVAVVLYEELANDPIARTKQLFHEIGLPFTEQVNRFILSSTSKKTGLLPDAGHKYYSVYRNTAPKRLRDVKAELRKKDLLDIDRFLEGVSPKVDIRAC